MSTLQFHKFFLTYPHTYSAKQPWNKKFKLDIFPNM